MKKFLFLFLSLVAVNLFAEDNYEVGVAFGRPDSNDFGEILSSQTAPYSTNTKVVMIDAGYKIVDDAFDLPLDFYVKGGFAKFFENGYADDVYENTLYIKAYYTFDVLKNAFRLGFAEGASYTYGTLHVEKLDAIKNHGKNSNYLNYLELSLDYDLGNIVDSAAFKKLYLGVEIKHRSGIFGLINNVKHGGSNYEAVYIEKNF
jgi:outer membrane protein